MSTNEQFKAFIDACEDLRKSKIILADSKISALVRSIVSTPTLIAIVGEALTGYNFPHELETLKSDNGIHLPSEPYRIIAFVFSLLSEIDARRMDLQEFVDGYFKDETLAESFARFNTELMVPFRECLCTWAGSGAPKKKSVKKESQPQNKVEECPCAECNAENIDVVDEFFATVETILAQIKDTVALDSKIKPDRLADINITINACFEATAMQNFRIFNALLISLKHLLNTVKSVRFYNLELQNTVADFYISSTAK